MTVETKMAEVVAEAIVAAEGAKVEAELAQEKTAEAIVDAHETEEAARRVEEMADRAERVATFDAEERISKFKEELETCRQQIASLQSTMTAMAEQNQSISQELTTLAWLKEVTMTAEELAALKAARSETSSETDGDTSGRDGGKTSKQETESGAPDGKKVNPESGERSMSAERNLEKAAREARKERHRWL